MPSFDTSSTTSAFDAVSYLLAALGLSSTAGLRAYLPLLAMGIASDIITPDGNPLLPLQSNFDFLGNPFVLVILGILVLGEVVADKIPVIDHISDLIHTIIRPAAGAIILAGTQNPLSDMSTPVAAVAGAALALATHGLKASTRAAVTTTTAGTANPIVSIIEDALVVVVILLLLLAPIIGVIALAAFIVLLWKAVSWLVRSIRRFFGGGGSSGQAPAPAPAAPAGYDATNYYPPSGPTYTSTASNPAGAPGWPAADPNQYPQYPTPTDTYPGTGGKGSKWLL